MENFLQNIYQWYYENRRDLPWRDSTDPYKIWISEIILQQTRVVQGISYYEKFIQRFPTVNDLAQAREDDVLRLWQGLGYYSRARNLLVAARQVIDHHGGLFPDKYDDIRALKGIGVYTAAAIASFAYHLPFAAVDGNIGRVLARLYGISIPINGEKGKRILQQLAQSLIPEKCPALHNQALMEFGALQCVPGLPDCSECPVRLHCHAFLHQQAGVLPIRIRSSEKRTRYFTYFLVEQGYNLWLQKRTSKDIWENLYQLPLVETDKSLTDQEMLALVPSLLNECSTQICSLSGSFRHILSHQSIIARAIHIAIPPECVVNENCISVSRKDISRYALPKLVERILEYFFE